jgi:tetratricopeptide (TPR) repeat protein
MQCENCGEELVENARFCESCGAEVLVKGKSVPVHSCGSCGASNQFGAFCEGCGKRLDLQPRSESEVENQGLTSLDMEFVARGVADLWREKQFPEALEFLAVALSKAPNDAKLLLMKAMSLDGLGHTMEAYECTQQSLKADSGNKNAWRFCAAMQMKLGRGAEAHASLDRVLAIDPADAGALFYKGRLLHAIQCNTAAEHFFREAQRFGHPEAGQWISRCR